MREPDRAGLLAAAGSCPPMRDKDTPGPAAPAAETAPASPPPSHLSPPGCNVRAGSAPPCPPSPSKSPVSSASHANPVTPNASNPSLVPPSAASVVSNTDEDVNTDFDISYELSQSLPADLRRKSVENLVISSQDAIGQSISQALSFSGVISQASQFTPFEQRRSPSPGCRSSSSAEVVDNPKEDSGGNFYSSLSVSKSSTHSNASSPLPSISVNISPPDQQTSNSSGSLNRSLSNESQTKTSIQPSNSSSNLKSQKTADNKENKPKKKAWYSALYPTYKKRSEDFKKIFKYLPEDERLIVDYSCAMQKDILIQGRLYISQNYLCFYANIFGWETFLNLQWKDVTSITKEKTAIVIPNAILISTENDKHFFTSFVGRDTTYLMLFRIWQNALIKQQMSNQEIWQWVRLCYGEELGFDSDECMNKSLEEDKLSGNNVSIECMSEELPNLNMSALTPIPGEGIEDSINIQRSGSNEKINGEDTLPTDMSDSSGSETGKPVGFSSDTPIECTHLHDGKNLLSLDLPIHIDQLFTMIFTNSQFYVELLASRKTTDLVEVPWKNDPETGLKIRKVSFTLFLGQTVGPKTSNVTETQVMLPCTKPGHLYSIEITSSNAGVPYADSFTVTVHYCIRRVSDNLTHLETYGNVKYKKNVWGLVKSLIDKNCYGGLVDYFTAFSKAITSEIEENTGQPRRRNRKRRRAGLRDLENGASQSTPKHAFVNPTPNARIMGTPIHSAHNEILPASVLLWIILFVLCILVIVNVVLYRRLWKLESTHTTLDEIDFKSVLNSVYSDGQPPSPDSITEWTDMLKKQLSHQVGELGTWRKALNDAIASLKDTEVALGNLQKIIKISLENKMSCDAIDQC